MNSAKLSGGRHVDPANLPMKIPALHSVEMFPELSNRKAWEIPGTRKEFQRFRKEVISEAEKLLAEPIPELPASKFMEFQLNGNRKRFENLYFERRYRLEVLFLAEAFEYKGRFTARMIDELWAILNEPTWCLPAHRALGYRKPEESPAKADPLAWFDFEVVDLFSAQTSAYLSTIYRMANKELSQVSPGLVRRLRETIYNRSIGSLNTASEHYWWRNKGKSNWTPWICCNLLITANHLLPDDPQQLTAFVKKHLQVCMDRYMAQYLEDGGGIEGPSYWNVSVGRAMGYYELLYCQSNGKCSLYDSAKFRRMAGYIADSMFGPNAVACFADSPPKPGIFPAGRVTRFAERTGCEKLLTLCHAYRNAVPLQVINRGSSGIVRLENLFYETGGTGKFRSEFVSWYPNLQQLFVHAGRMGFAAKGGSNHEKHNHNDVGQFILAADGEIFLADVGNCEYTRDTFSDKRYENPVIGFPYHNAPVFNGMGEQQGKADSAARNVEFKEKGDVLFLTMDLVELYPAELQLISCKRTFELDRKKKSLTVTDEWKARKPLEYSLTLFTTSEWKKGPYSVAATSPAECVRFKMTDPAMKQNWKALWKTSIKTGKKELSGKHVMQFHLLPAGNQSRTAPDA